MNPIRFQCQSCSQPIEVDEEWAGKAVACPYCKATVTAPAQSTLMDLDQIHTASPVATATDPLAQATPDQVIPVVQSRNTVAVVALSLSILLIALFIAGAIIITPHQMEMEHFQEMYQESDKSTNSQMQIIKDFSDQYGGSLPGWFMIIAMIEVASIPIFIAAVVCGIIGVRRRYRKNLAVISLAICSGMFFFFVVGILFAL